MMRLIASLLRLVFPEHKPRRSSGDVYWQVPTSTGRHALGCARYAVPPSPPSPVIAVSMRRDEWLKVSAELTWNNELVAPEFALLHAAIIGAIALDRQPVNPVTQWHLRMEEELWRHDG